MEFRQTMYYEVLTKFIETKNYYSSCVYLHLLGILNIIFYFFGNKITINAMLIVANLFASFFSCCIFLVFFFIRILFSLIFTCLIVLLSIFITNDLSLLIYNRLFFWNSFGIYVGFFILAQEILCIVLLRWIASFKQYFFFKDWLVSFWIVICLKICCFKVLILVNLTTIDYNLSW